MNLKTLKDRWDLLIGLTGALVLFFSGIVAAPSYAAAAISQQISFENVAKFIVMMMIGVVLVIGWYSRKKNHIWVWGLLTLVSGLAGLWFWSERLTLKSETTIDYTSYGGGFVVKGNQLLPEMQLRYNELKEANGGKLDEVTFFAENHEIIDSTGVLTAQNLWPKQQIIVNAKRNITTYMFVVCLLSLSALCLLQVIHCITNRKDEKPADAT